MQTKRAFLGKYSFHNSAKNSIGVSNNQILLNRFNRIVLSPIFRRTDVRSFNVIALPISCPTSIDITIKSMANMLIIFSDKPNSFLLGFEGTDFSFLPCLKFNNSIVDSFYLIIGKVFKKPISVVRDKIPFSVSIYPNFHAFDKRFNVCDYRSHGSNEKQNRGNAIHTNAIHP